MNILYIGPYRDETTTGCQSLNYLKTISQHFANVLSRPVFSHILETATTAKKDEVLFNTENKTFRSFDVLIQHMNIDNMVYTNKIPNIFFIPIFSRKFPTPCQSQRYHFLSSKGTVLYSNSIGKYIVNNLKLKNSHQISEQPHSSMTSNILQKIKLGAYDSMKKYYTIVNNDCKELVYDLIVKFIGSNFNKNNCLLLFLQNFGQDDLDAYKKFIQDIYHNFNISNSFNRVSIIPVASDINTSQIIHRTGDIYIDLCDDFQQYFAYLNSSQCIKYSSELSLAWAKNNTHKYGYISHVESLDLNNIHNKPRVSDDPSIVEIIKNVIK